jgi:hypothetical protein
VYPFRSEYSVDLDIPFSRTATGSYWIALVARSFHANALAADLAVLAVTSFRGTLEDVIGSSTFSSGLLISSRLEEEEEGFPAADTIVEGECSRLRMSSSSFMVSDLLTLNSPSVGMEINRQILWYLFFRLPFHRPLRKRDRAADSVIPTISVIMWVLSYSRHHLSSIQEMWLTRPARHLFPSFASCSRT